MSDQTSSPDYEKQALGAALMESIQGALGLRATILQLQAENARLAAVAAAQVTPPPDTFAVPKSVAS